MDVQLEVALTRRDWPCGTEILLTRGNAKLLYWSVAQQVIRVGEGLCRSVIGSRYVAQQVIRVRGVPVPSPNNAIPAPPARQCCGIIRPPTLPAFTPSDFFVRAAFRLRTTARAAARSSRAISSRRAPSRARHSTRAARCSSGRGAGPIPSRCRMAARAASCTMATRSSCGRERAEPAENESALASASGLSFQRSR